MSTTSAPQLPPTLPRPYADSVPRSVPAALAVAGVLFVIYPALRPYSAETGLDGARAFASWQWAAAHLCGIAGFVLVAQAVGRLGLGRVGPVLTALGASLVLPYYGAEVFGVGAVGRAAIDLDAPSLVTMLSDDIRFSAPAVALFALGLGLLAAGGITLGITLWRDGARAAGVLLLLGLALYLPQFYLPPALRIAHGVLLGLGLVLTAWHATRRSPHPAG